MSKKINLALIFGGKSDEHLVSLSSAYGIYNALDKDKYNVVRLAITKNGKWLDDKKSGEYLEKYRGIENIADIDDDSYVTEKIEDTLKDIDLIFPIIHGAYGEDGRLQGLFDVLEIPYVFSGTLSSALAMDKHKSKILVENNGVRVASDILLQKDSSINTKEIIEKLGLPLVVKPSDSGSSVGIYIVEEEKDLEEKIKKSFEFSDNILLEQFIKGPEYTISVVSDNTGKLKTFPIIEIISNLDGFYSYDAKYKQGGSKHVCPADISEDLKNEMTAFAKTVFKILGCKDIARADFLLSENNELYFLEINTVPGMTPTSLVPESAKEAGYSFGGFLDLLIGNYLK